MLWEPEWDEFHAIAVKCVWSLGVIGTPAARVALEDAATVGPLEVRNAARLELDRLEVGDGYVPFSG